MGESNKYPAIGGYDHSSHKTQCCRLGCHEWSVARLHQIAVDLPVYDIPIVALNLSDVLSDGGMRVREFLGHMKAVLAADLNYPIILDEDGEIMDGRHRILRAMHEKRSTIKAVRFEENPTPCRVED